MIIPLIVLLIIIIGSAFALVVIGLRERQGKARHLHELGPRAVDQSGNRHGGP